MADDMGTTFTLSLQGEDGITKLLKDAQAQINALTKEARGAIAEVKGTTEKLPKETEKTGMLAGMTWERAGQLIRAADNALKALGDSAKTGTQKFDGVLAALSAIPGPVGAIAGGARVLSSILPSPFEELEKRARAATKALVELGTWQRSVIQASIASYQAEGYREAAIAMDALKKSGTSVDEVLKQLPDSERLFVEGLNSAEKAAYAFHSAGMVLPPALQSIYDRIADGRGYMGELTEGMSLAKDQAEILGRQLQTSKATIAGFGEAAKLAAAGMAAFAQGTAEAAGDARQLLITRMAMQQDALDRAEQERQRKVAASAQAAEERRREAYQRMQESTMLDLKLETEAEAERARIQAESIEADRQLYVARLAMQQDAVDAKREAYAQEADDLAAHFDSAREKIDSFAGMADSPLAKAASVALKQAKDIASALAAVRKAGGDESAALVKSIPGAISAVGQFSAAFISDKGAQYVIEGLGEEAAALASLAIPDPRGAVTHQAAAAAYFYAASQAGKQGKGGGGGSVGGAASSRGGGYTPPAYQASSTATSPSAVSVYIGGVLAANQRELGQAIVALANSAAGRGATLDTRLIPRYR